MHASCDLTVMDLAINGLHSKYGDDADSREDYLAIEQQRDENIEILSSVRAESWAGIWAKAAALRSKRTIEDYESALAIAASLADDIMLAEAPEGLAVAS
jgi:predicted metalloprotease